jgi:hypothetical protein
MKLANENYFSSLPASQRNYAKSGRKPDGVIAVSGCKSLWKWKPPLVDKPIEFKSAKECE